MNSFIAEIGLVVIIFLQVLLKRGTVGRLLLMSLSKKEVGLTGTTVQKEVPDPNPKLSYQQLV